MATIRIAGVQMAVSAKLSENAEKIIGHIAQGHCDFLLFPSMSLTGTQEDVPEQQLKAAWRQIATACRQAYVTAIIGTCACIENSWHMQSRIYSDTGELVGAQESLIPTARDRALWSPGEELRVFRHRDLTFGCLIGNDLWVAPGMGPYPDPRLTWQLAKQGAQVIFHAMDSGTDPHYAAYFESNLLLRAKESGVYIVTANAAAPNASVNAATGVVGPDGQWAVKCSRSGEQRFSIDLEIETE